MSEQKPFNPGRRRFFGKLLREASLLTREARLAAQEIEKAASDTRKVDVELSNVVTQQAIGEDISVLVVRMDAAEKKSDELYELVPRLVQAIEHSRELAAEDRALLPKVMESLADLRQELVDIRQKLAEKSPTPVDEEKGNEAEESANDEIPLLRRRLQIRLDDVLAWIKTLLTVGLLEILFEIFVSDELVPWTKEQWRGIFAQAEAAGVIERSPLASPLPSPTAESPRPSKHRPPSRRRPRRPAAHPE